MNYYCNICKKDITKEEFHYSMDKFGRPLCREHQELEKRNQEISFKKYYCNNCKKDITEGVFRYSMDKFGRPLCREHQDLERTNQESSFHSENQAVGMMELEPSETQSEALIDSDEKNNIDVPKGGWKSLGKKIVVKMGKGIIKGVKKVVDSSKKRNQIRKWKESILRRMTRNQLEQLAFEESVSTTDEVKNYTRSGKQYWKKVKCSGDKLVIRLKGKALDTIISFAKRNFVRIRDILVEIDRAKAEWERKKLTKRIKVNGSNELLKLERAIKEFVPLRQYPNEMLYQDTLANFLRGKYNDVQIEIPRGSTRIDILVDGIAIEVKGPTNFNDLKSIADKCNRYKQYFPKGLIIVLFNITVTQHLYEDWYTGLKKQHPDVVIIKI